MPSLLPPAADLDLDVEDADDHDRAPRPPATAHEIRAVAVASHRDPRTVVNAYQGRATGVAVAAVAHAAVRLGFAPPPEGR